MTEPIDRTRAANLWEPFARKFAPISKASRFEAFASLDVDQIGGLEDAKEEVLTYWRSLRARSSVELEDVKFEGTATRRRINLDVTVDGIEAGEMCILPNSEDPDVFSRRMGIDGLEALLNDPVPLLDFYLSHLKKQSGSYAGKAR